MSLTVIVAATRQNGIGKGSKLPWRLPQDMSYFANVTSNAPEGYANAVVMGRTTWESIPPKFRPLKNRINLVLSRNENYLSSNEMNQNTDSSESLTRLALVTNVREELAYTLQTKVLGVPIHKAFIIGGASLYNEVLKAQDIEPSSGVPLRADRILLTRILSPTFDDCDTFFPEFRDARGDDGELQWVQASHDDLQDWVGIEVPKGTQTEKGVEFEFQMWTRQK